MREYFLEIADMLKRAKPKPAPPDLIQAFLDAAENKPVNILYQDFLACVVAQAKIEYNCGEHVWNVFQVKTAARLKFAIRAYLANRPDSVLADLYYGIQSSLLPDYKKHWLDEMKERDRKFSQPYGDLHENKIDIALDRRKLMRIIDDLLAEGCGYEEPESCWPEGSKLEKSEDSETVSRFCGRCPACKIAKEAI